MAAGIPRRRMIPREPKILVVDDDAEFLHRLCGILRLARYHVLMAANLSEATKILDQSHEDIGLVIIDLVLPESSGFELIGAITRRPNPMKILATSAIFSDPQLYTAIHVGADLVIHKPQSGQPIPETEWLSAVRQLLPQTDAGRASP